MKYVSKKAATVIVAAMFISVIALLSGCSGGNGAIGGSNVAATVNGTDIKEDTVTEYIENFRSINSLEDDKEWAQWLVNNGRDPESLRQDTIDYYVRLTVIDQEAKAQDVTVSEEDINSQLEEIQGYYGYDDEEFLEQIESIGYTMDSYRDYIKQSITQEKLTEAIGSDEVSDEEVLNTVNMYSSILNGAKEIKTIAMYKDDAEKAAEVAASAKTGDFDVIAKENSKSDVYDGWDVLIPIDSAVADAIVEMNVGDVSDLIEGADWLFVVKVVDACQVGDDGFKALSEVPAGLVSEFKESAVSSTKSSSFENYIQEKIDTAEVNVNPMPSGLSYDVSLEGVEADYGEETDATENETDGDTEVETAPAEGDDQTVGDENAATGEGESTPDEESSTDGQTDDGAIVIGEGGSTMIDVDADGIHVVDANSSEDSEE